jgi:ATP-dependent helicase HrpA
VKAAERKSKGELRRTCKDSFLSFVRIREWFEIHRQLEDTVKELRLERHGNGSKGSASSPDALHGALLTGLLSKVGFWNAEQRIYIGAKQTRFAIHPSSALARKPPAWVMAFELVETSQLFARMVARIEPEQILAAGTHLLKRSYGEPHWSAKSARASVKEHATLFGLSVARDRSVDYAKVAPAAARKIFLEHALVRGEYSSRGAFQQKNQELLAEVARLRAKARKSDMLADDDALLAFFDRRVSDAVVDGRTFEEWREHAEKADANVLVLSLEDVLVGEPDLSPAMYPDEVELHGARLPVTYRFDPSAEDDGIALAVPLVLIPQIEPGELDWTIPGWHEDKIAALLEELPRADKKDLGGSADLRSLAHGLAAAAKPFSGPMIPALVRAIEAETGVRVREEAFRTDAVAAYLRATIRVVDVDGRVVTQNRDADDLLRRFGARARTVLTAAAAPSKWTQEGLTSWTFGDLPPFVVRKLPNTTAGAAEVRSYPAIVDRGTSVALELAESEAAAEAASRSGVRRLLMLAARQTLSALTPRLPPPLARPRGALPSRAESDAVRAQLLGRIVDTAFRLEDTPLPRNKQAFDALVAFGTPRLDATFRVFVDLLKPIATELDRVLAALKSASRHPSGRHAIDDIYAQLEELVPPDFVARTPFDRLEHVPRYLRAVQARLQRAIADPRKDMAKHAPFAPLWKTFLAKRPGYRDAAAAEDLRWTFEELRVAIFAPEQKPAAPVSAAKVAAALSALR